MVITCVIFSILNFLGLCIAAVIYFKDNFTIVSLEQWNTVVKFYNAHFDEYDEDGNPLPEEKSGGVGFHLYTEEELEEDSEDEEND